jgi:integrase
MFLDEITTGEVKRYVSHLEKRGLAPMSVVKALTVVRLVFASAVEDDDYGLPANPALGLRVSRRRGDGQDEPIKVMDPNQLGRLLDALPEDMRLFFNFLFETGLRIGEAIELRWGDVDATTGRLSIDRQFSRGRLGKPKGNKTRKVRLSARMTLELRSLRGARPDGDLVFTAGARRTADPLEHDAPHPQAGRDQGRARGLEGQRAGASVLSRGSGSTPSATPARRSSSCAAGTRSRSPCSSATPIRGSRCVPTFTCCRTTYPSRGVTTQ